MTKQKGKKNGWAWIRIRDSTGNKLKILKGKLGLTTYDEVLEHLLSKEKLEFK